MSQCVKSLLVAQLRSYRVDSKGQSLVSVMVGAGVMGIVMMGFMSMQTMQNKEARALTEKFASLSLKNVVSAALADGTVCLLELNGKTFDSSSAATISAASISVNQIHANADGVATVAVAGQKASADSNSLIVNSIKLTNFVGSGKNYSANWVLDFKTGNLVRPIKAVTIPVTLIADNSVPSSTKITGCMTASGTESSSLPTCTDAGQYLQWNGSAWICRTLVSCDGTWSACSGGGTYPATQTFTITQQPTNGTKCPSSSRSCGYVCECPNSGWGSVFKPTNLDGDHCVGMEVWSCTPLTY